MPYLLFVSFVWAFSFGLIKGELSGVDPYFVAFARLGLSCLLFLPFLFRTRVRAADAVRLGFIGAVQFGVMYITYIYSYRYLASYQVALYTLFTPIYVTLLADLLERRLHGRALAAAILAVVGAYVVLGREAGRWELRTGFLLLQCSNLCFASGQVFYRLLMNRTPGLRDREAFPYCYLGAVAVTGLSAGLLTPWGALTITPRQWGVLAYLGILASGICFFLWNLGARRTGTGRLSVMNNLKIPLAVACSLLFFGEHADLLRLGAGGGILLAALFLNEKGEGGKRRPRGGARPSSRTVSGKKL